MEVYEAKFDYVKERDDVLSFTKGEKFYITNKTTDKWWAAKKIVDNTYGYVPSFYLKPSTERVIGRLVPEGRRDTEEHKIHLRALAEIHKKVKPLPVPKTALRLEGLARTKPPPPPTQHKRSQTHRGYPVVATTTASPTSPTLPTPPMSPNQVPPYKKHSWPHSPPSVVVAETHGYYPTHPYNMNSSGRYSSLSSEDSGDLSPTPPGADEAFLIKPKPLSNPVKDSKEHKQLHRELRLSYRSGGPLPQKSELSKVNRERRIEEKKKEYENDKKSRRTSMELKLQERQEKERMEEEKEQRMVNMKEQEAIAEERKPEFMKVRLKQTNSNPKS